MGFTEFLFRSLRGNELARRTSQRDQMRDADLMAGEPLKIALTEVAGLKGGNETIEILDMELLCFAILENGRNPICNRGIADLDIIVF